MKFIITAPDESIRAKNAKWDTSEANATQFLNGLSPQVLSKIVQDQKGLQSLSATLHSVQELPAKESAALGEHGDLMGYVRVNGYGSSALELEVGIAPKYRRQGYGRELLRRVIQEIFCTTGAERLVYRVRPDNIASIRLIGSLGGVLQEPDSVAEKL